MVRRCDDWLALPFGFLVGRLHARKSMGKMIFHGTQLLLVHVQCSIYQNVSVFTSKLTRRQSSLQKRDVFEILSTAEFAICPFCAKTV